MHRLAAAQVAGKPLSVSEWNVEAFPAPDRHAIPLYVAASASLQGWAALMQYAYAQVPLNSPGDPSNWHAFNDPAMVATLPAAALLYRRGDVHEAGSVYAFAPGKEQLFNQYISPQDAVALRTAAERGKLVIALPQTSALPWLEKGAIPDGAKVITDPRQALIKSDATEVVSDTGELRRNWDQGIYTVNTPRTQAAMGWIGEPVAFPLGTGARPGDDPGAQGAQAVRAEQSCGTGTRNPCTLQGWPLPDQPRPQSRNVLASAPVATPP